MAKMCTWEERVKHVGRMSSCQVYARRKGVIFCSVNVCNRTLRFSQSSTLVAPPSNEATYYPSSWTSRISIPYSSELQTSSSHGILKTTRCF
ncbi:hypothetical protein TNCV_2183651 [Trichonephila clavipes]|nr:hypothetical protein TNCV_2183651 [Trichonephila clavipes]